MTGINFDTFLEAVKAQFAPALLLFPWERDISKALPRLVENGFAVTHDEWELARACRLDLPIAHVVRGEMAESIFNLIRFLSIEAPSAAIRRPKKRIPCHTLLLLLDCEALEKAERKYSLLNYVELCERFSEVREESLEGRP